MEVRKQQKTKVIFHLSGGIRRSLKLESQFVAPLCTSLENKELHTVKGGVPPAVRMEEILWK